MRQRRMRSVGLDLTRILYRPHAVAQVSNLLYRRASSLLVFRTFQRAQNRLQPCRLEIGDQPRKLSGYTGWKPALLLLTRYV